MTVVPLTQAALRLGIDAKTLRRWLSDAQLPLHSDPQDARIKGVRVEHVHLLAQQHQRSLLASSSEHSAPKRLHPSHCLQPCWLCPRHWKRCRRSYRPCSSRSRRSRTCFNSLLLPPAVPCTPPQKTTRRSARATPSTPRTRPIVKAQNKPVPVIPRVEYRTDGCYVVIGPKTGLLPFEPEAQELFAWVREQESFRFVGRCGHFTAHHEWTTPRGAWRAHRQIRNHSYTLPLAPNQELTIAVLEHAAEALQAHLI